MGATESGSPGRFEIDDGSLLNFASALARTPSQSGRESAAVELSVERFRSLGFDHVEVDEVGNAIGIMGSGAGPRLLIDGHIDSIPLHSQERWSVDPFGAQIIEGRLYGLGICDQKGSIAAAAHGIAAAKASRGSFGGTVALTASVSEEELEGAALASFVDRFRPDFAVTSEPSDTRLCIGQRGRAKLSVRVVGRACHAGHRSRGINASEALASIIVAVSALGHPTHPQLGVRDITCIDIASQPYPSVSTVPGEATARFDCRFLPGQTSDALLQEVRACAETALSGWAEQPAVEVGICPADFCTWTGTQFTLPEFEPAWWTDDGSDLVRGAVAALDSVGIDSTPTHYSFCTNGSFFAGELGIPTIGFGVGVEHIAHQVDEHITLDSLRRGAQGFAAIAAQLVA